MTVARAQKAHQIKLQKLCLLVLGGLVACSGATKQGARPVQPSAAAQPPVDRSRCDKDGKRVVAVDVNEDKKADVWKYFVRKSVGGADVDVLSCKSTDLNFDGRRDVWYHYDDNGNLLLEEMDLDFDGRIDLVTIRQAGKIQRQEMDTNYDGKADIWKLYDQEALTQVHRDSNWDGRVDYWEYYEGGQLDRIGYDTTGDGRIDNWDRVTQEAAPSDQAPDSAAQTSGGPQPSAKAQASVTP